MEKKKKVTIDVIAEAAGVSKTTVSRYLNGRTELMSKATAKKIQNIIELCDYRPSEYARALKNNRTKMIGIIVSDILSPWTSAFIGGCEEVLSEEGYSALFLNSNNSIKKEKELAASLETRGVEGLIVNPASYNDPYLMKYSLSGMPLVICDRLVKDYPFNAVIAGIREPINALIAHLKSQGFTRPVLFSLTKHENYARMIRVKAFKEMIPSIQAVKQVETYLRDASLKYSFDILDDLSATTAESMNNYKKFKNRNICSGNVTSLTILPDGRVTICEELYWNENFIIGDLTKSSIIDVWNSNKSKSISCLKQKDIPKNSPCSSCTDFEGCRYDRGVCWKEVVAVYGTANWLFPDPTCPFAPQLINDVFYDKI